MKNEAQKSLPQKKQKKKNIFQGLFGIGLLCTAASLVMIVQGICKQPAILANREEVSRLTTQIEYEKQRQAEIDNMRLDANTDEYIEMVARERLGMVKNDEIVFVDVSEK